MECRRSWPRYEKCGVSALRGKGSIVSSKSVSIIVELP